MIYHDDCALAVLARMTGGRAANLQEGRNLSSSFAIRSRIGNPGSIRCIIYPCPMREA